MTSLKLTSNFIESLVTNTSKIRKITLATLILAVSLSVAVEIEYTTSLVQGYSTKADSYIAFVVHQDKSPVLSIKACAR